MARKTAAQADALRSLRAQWALFFLFGAPVIVAGFALMAQSWPGVNAWVAVAAVAFAFQMAILWFDLHLNKTERGALRPRFGAAMWLSLARLPLLALLAGFLLPPRPEGALAWAPFFLYLLFNLLDLADGYVARTTGSATKLGAKLDMDLDGLGMLVAALLAVRYGMVGWWYLLVGLARYIYVLAIHLRTRLGLPFKSTDNNLRRPFAGVQMGVGTTLLAPPLSPLMGNYMGSFTMIPFLANFAYDWIVGIGWLGKSPSLSPRLNSAFGALLLIVRLVLALLLYGLLVIHPVYFFLSIALAVGISVRISAVFFLITFSALAKTPNSLDLLLISGLLLLLFAGAGEFSLIKEKDAWFFRRAGSRRE